jgi:hypothetical protein
LIRRDRRVVVGKRGVEAGGLAYGPTNLSGGNKEVVINRLRGVREAE